MSKPYPMELRERAVRFVEAGESRHVVAARLGLSPSCVIKWMALYRTTGSVRPGKSGGHFPRKTRGEHLECVLEQTEAGGDVILQGLADGLSVRGLKVDCRTMWNSAYGDGKSFKKKRRCMALSRTATIPAHTRARPSGWQSEPLGKARLPACLHPNLNPIEQVFAKLKHFIRKAKERSVEATWRRIGAVLPSFTSKEHSN